MRKSKRKWRRSCSKSGYFGVRKGRDRGRIEKYRAQIYINGKNKYRAHIYIDGNQKYLGTYDTAKQAAKAHDKEAIHLRRPFSALNYPKQAPVGYTPIQKARLSNNVVGYRGVYYTPIYTNGKKYQASIYIDRKKTHLGNYDTAHEAAVAYDRAVLKANKSTSYLNFPFVFHNLIISSFSKLLKDECRRRRKDECRSWKDECRSWWFKNGTFDKTDKAFLAFDQTAIKPAAGRKKSTFNFLDGLPIKEKEKESAKDGGYLVGGFIIQPYL